MEAKLIKVENTFYLKQGGTILGTSSYPNLSASIGYSLSLENCQAIERGYDLDEFKNNYIQKQLKNLDEDSYEKYLPFAEHDADIFIEGVQKALEILGDKKFSEEDVIRAIQFGWDDEGMCRKEISEKYGFVADEYHSQNIKPFIQSLQQTEWDVEVEMDGPLVYPANLPKEGEERPDYKPKLDERGRLTLKRK